MSQVGQTSLKGHLKYKLNQYVFLLVLNSMMTCYSSLYIGIIVMLDKFFTMHIDDANECFKLYQKFSKNSEQFSKFIEDHKFIPGFDTVQVDALDYDNKVLSCMNAYVKIIEKRNRVPMIRECRYTDLPQDEEDKAVGGLIAQGAVVTEKMTKTGAKIEQAADALRKRSFVPKEGERESVTRQGQTRTGELKTEEKPRPGPDPAVVKSPDTVTSVKDVFISPINNHNSSNNSDARNSSVRSMPDHEGGRSQSPSRRDQQSPPRQVKPSQQSEEEIAPEKDPLDPLFNGWRNGYSRSFRLMWDFAHDAKIETEFKSEEQFFEAYRGGSFDHVVSPESNKRQEEETLERLTQLSGAGEESERSFRDYHCYFSEDFRRMKESEASEGFSATSLRNTTSRVLSSVGTFLKAGDLFKK
eukprot:TRINITY_DN8278_c0_g2_i6.p1 TRINITY_DN8278_c0_g2~~TRINITY_DN8278_c0_g2_i6.p1  ORF type:complete len:413 (-),score=96.91 TRINITY_DN8278_c0_g2_i6:128-1366(-)